jgi:hypothetical protein
MDEAFQPDDADDWDADEYTRKHTQALALPSAAPASHAPNPVPSYVASRSPQRGRSTSAIHVERPVPHKGKPNNFPGFIARSAMFRAATTNDEFDQPTVVRAQGCTLTLSGPKLGMRDKHVWETAIQVAKERAPAVGDAFEIELRDFARRMGSNNRGAKALAATWKSLEKLALCRAEFELGNSCKGIGSLISTLFRENGRIYIRLNPDFAIPALLGDKQFLFDQSRRAALPSALSQWLHDFFSTHKQSREMDLLYLRELCGYDGSPKNFPSKLRAAMEALIKAAPTLVASFEFDDAARCSDAWMLHVVLGSETPSFLPAERIDLAPKTGRGRVAL